MGIYIENQHLKNYKEAEKELLDWLKKYQQIIPIVYLSFILNFRVWDLNRLASEPVKDPYDHDHHDAAEN